MPSRIKNTVQVLCSWKEYRDLLKRGEGKENEWSAIEQTHVVILEQKMDLKEIATLLYIPIAISIL